MTSLTEDLRGAGWKLSPDGRAIEKDFLFDNFRAAITWMLRAAFEAEMLNHHPEWSNVYNKVYVRLTTHDTNGLTEKDISLAKQMEAL